MAGLITVSSAFEGGSIGVDHVGRDGDIRLRLLADENAADTHWFYFRLSGARHTDCTMTLVNSDRMARLDGREDVPDCWTGYRPFASYDARHWFRTDAAYENGLFSIRHKPERDVVYYAYYPAYSMERHAQLIGRCLRDDRVRLESLTTTPDGWDLDLLTVGTGRLKCWVIARQHASETMASWFIEGLLARLLDRNDALSRALLDACVFHIVPIANPDGCARGNTRTNALGMNLNRAWNDPDAENAPEVRAIRDRMMAEGVDFCLDIHGDEELPYMFLGGPLEIPSRSDRLDSLFARYQHAQATANPDYRPSEPYPGGPPEKADLRMAWNWIAEQFDCLSILVEQPFKDTTHTPEPDLGWSPARCARLGRSTLDAISAVVPHLRGAA